MKKFVLMLIACMLFFLMTTQVFAQAAPRDKTYVYQFNYCEAVSVCDGEAAVCTAFGSAWEGFCYYMGKGKVFLAIKILF